MSTTRRLLSGATATAGGTVSYSVYGNANCSGLITVLGPVSVTNGSVPDSPDWTAVGPAQTDYFVASYSGDPTTPGAQRLCRRPGHRERQRCRP